MNHPSSRTGTVSALGLLCGLGLAGCGTGPSLVPVEGKVTIQRAPANAGAVKFWPTVETDSKMEITGKIGPDGVYKMTTNGRAGVPQGTYKVTAGAMIVPPTGPVSNEPPGALQIPKNMPPPLQVPKSNGKYQSPDTTDLTVVVPSPSYDLQLVR